MEQKVRECVKQIRKITDFEPQVALILGSGLGALADEIECVASIDYHEIPGFPVSTVAGHNGRLFDGGCRFAGSCDVFTGSENLVFDKCSRRNQ